MFCHQTACASTTMKFTALLTLLPGSKNLERQSNVESRLISDRRALTSLGTSPYEVLFFVQYVRQPAVVVQVLNESGWLKYGIYPHGSSVILSYDLLVLYLLFSMIDSINPCL